MRPALGPPSGSKRAGFDENAALGRACRGALGFSLVDSAHGGATLAPLPDGVSHPSLAGKGSPMPSESHGRSRVERPFALLANFSSASAGETSTPQRATGEASGRISVCDSLLLGAITVLAAAGSGLVIGAALGLLGVPLLIVAGVTASTGLALLAVWMMQCRDCRAIRYLQRYFLVMAAVLLALSGPFLLAGMVGAAAGAVLVAGLFGLIVAALTVGASRLDCPAFNPGGTR